MDNLQENTRITTESHQSAATAQASSRNPYIDNARAILITLVVTGHLLPTISSYLGGAINMWIYAFHMPAFVAISGYLSRSYRNEPQQLGRILSALFVPYVLFQVLQAVLRVVVRGQDFDLHLWSPSWTLWFLLALFVWRLATPLFKALRYPIVFALAIAVIAPIDPSLDTILTWGRILAFLPFFVLGLLTRPEHLEKLQEFKHKYLGYVVLATGLALSFMIHERYSISIFYMSTSYEKSGISSLHGVLARMLILAAAALAVLAFLVVTPQRRHWWTNIGRNSLTVYLLHAPIIYALRYSSFMDGIDGALGTVLVVLAAVALTLALSREWVSRTTRWLTNPPISSWFIKETGGSDAARRARQT